MGEDENRKWVIKVGLNSMGTADMRQMIYESFRVKLHNSGQDVDLGKTGLMGIDPDEVLVEVSPPSGGHVYYGLATPDDVESVIDSHLVAGKPVTELIIPDNEIGNFFVKHNKMAYKKGRVVKANAQQRKETPNLRSGIKADTHRGEETMNPGGGIKFDINQWREALNLIGIGWFLGLSILAGVLGGMWLDSKFNTKPILLLVGLVLGVLVAFWGAYRMLLPLIRNKRD